MFNLLQRVCEKFENFRFFEKSLFCMEILERKMNRGKKLYFALKLYQRNNFLAGVYTKGKNFMRIFTNIKILANLTTKYFCYLVKRTTYEDFFI